MIKEKMKITVHATALSKNKNAVAGILDNLPEGTDHAPIKVIIGEEMKQGKRIIYQDEEKLDMEIGQIKELTDENGAKVTDDKIREMLEEGNYKIQLKSHEGFDFFGDLIVMKDPGSANQRSNQALSQDVVDAANKAVKNGFVTQADMDERLAFMKENKVDKFLMLRVISGYRMYNKPSHKPSCLYVDPFLSSHVKKKEEGIIAEGLRAAVGRNAIICEGEKSVGKNVYLETIAWLLNMPMYLITFNRQMSPSSVYGEKTTDNTAAKALAEFDPAILAKADDIKAKRQFMIDHFAPMQILTKEGKQENKDEQKARIRRCVDDMLTEEERNILAEAERFRMLQAQSASVNIIIDQSELYDWLVDGGLMCFNEMNMAEANFLASFANQLLDGTGFLFIPGRGEVPIHKDCVLFGTQNADYQGVEQQNEATMSRFGCLYFEQPGTIKAQLTNAVGYRLKKDGYPSVTVNDQVLTEAEAFYKQCRGAVTKGSLSNACLNIRGFVRAVVAHAESDGFARLRRQITIHVIDTCPVDERPALYTILESIVTL